MTTLLRHALVEPMMPPTLTLPRKRQNGALVGVGAAMVLWALLHGALVVSWLSAGKL